MRLTAKQKFFLGTGTLLVIFTGELAYLSSKPFNEDIKITFMHLSGVVDPAFHSNIPYLRHRSTSGTAELYFLHPGLREIATGTFIQSPSFSNEHP